MTPELKEKLSGSITGADSEAVQKAALAANPMRLLNKFTCLGCGHQWQMPAPTGACPRCGLDDPRFDGGIPCMALRI